MFKSPFVISFEGLDGCGKTTQVNLLVKTLTEKGLLVKSVREPGSTEAGTEIRTLLMTKKDLFSETEKILLFYASRAALLRSLCDLTDKPDVIIFDRFVDSTYAYQSQFGENDVLISRLHDSVCKGFLPHLTILLDLPVHVSNLRMSEREDEKTAFDNESNVFKARVRARYLGIATDNPERVHTLRAIGTPDEVFEMVSGLLLQHGSEKVASCFR